MHTIQPLESFSLHDFLFLPFRIVPLFLSLVFFLPELSQQAIAFPIFFVELGELVCHFRYAHSSL